MRQAHVVVLQQFDNLPNVANVRLPVVAALKGVSPATVWRMSADGRLPKPHKDGGVTGWNVGELRASMQLTAMVAA